MDWIHIVPNVDGAFTGIARYIPSFSVDAWHSSRFGVPNWFVVLLAIATSLLCTLRSAEHQIPRGSTIVLTSLGTLFCGLSLLASLGSDHGSAGVGLIVAFFTFLVWNSLELRRTGTASMHRHRRHRARRHESRP